MTTEWEILPKKNVRASRFGPKWSEVPAVSFSKTGLTANRKFEEAWLQGCSQLLICVSKDRRAIGIKPIKRGEEVPEAYKLCDSNKKGSDKAVYHRHISARGLIKLFPDCVGHAYRAHMSGNGMLIEVDLQPSNMLTGGEL